MSHATSTTSPAIDEFLNYNPVVVIYMSELRIFSLDGLNFNSGVTGRLIIHRMRSSRFMSIFLMVNKCT